MATTRSGEWSSMRESWAGESPSLPRVLIRIEQGAERGLVGQRSEIRILARKQTVARFQFNGAAEVDLGAGTVARQCLGERQRIVYVLGTGSDGQRLLQLSAEIGHVARIDQGHAVGVEIGR